MKNCTIPFLLMVLIGFGFFGVAEAQIYSEDFTGQDGQGAVGPGNTVDVSSVDWTVDVDSVTLSASSDFFRVESGVFTGQDLDGQSTNSSGAGAVWISPAIDISGYTEISISLNVGGSGTFEGADFIKASYSIDANDTTDFGSATDDDIKTASSFSVSGLSGSSLKIFVEMDNNAGSEVITFDDVLVEEVTVKSEPSEHAGSFTASSSSISQVDLSWTDGGGATSPEGYLILGNTTGSFTAPSDGTAQSDDTDLSDGSGVLNINQGVQSAQFTGLNSNTTYYFEIYSYTNSGSDIDYKTDGTIPSDNVSTLDDPDLVLNEILADPADGSAGDANGDGTRSGDDDEFLEFVNTGSSDLDISGWEILDSSSSRHTVSNSTILKPLQAIVIFGGGTPTGDFGGSIVQTTSSLGLNNGGEQITVKDDEGNTLIEYTYSGASDQSETRNPDLTGSFADHETADTDDASSFSPGTRLDGTHFQPSVEISGTTGWRMLSFPVSGGTVEDISDDTFIQGISGGDEADATDANFYLYDDSGAFEEPTDVTAAFGDGKGFIVYFFNNDSGLSSSLPITLEAFGVEPSSEVSVSLNKSTLSSGSYFTLAGNPFNSNYDLGSMTVTGGAVQSNVQFWDNGADSYVAGDISSSYITPKWQGFWVEVSDGNGATSIEFPTSGKSSSSATASYFSKKNNAEFDINFKLSSEQTYDKAIRLSFRDDAEIAWDLGDASKLVPLVSSGTPYATLAFASMNGDNTKLKSVESLPLALEGRHELYMEPSVSGTDGTFTLNWDGLENMPKHWTLTFHDYQEGETVDMSEANSYSFEATANVAAKTSSVFSGIHASPAQSNENHRFGITISAGDVVSNEGEPGMPTAFKLEQNYPNPFNPTTTIRYSIEQAGAVSLTIYNMMGQRVATLLEENKSPGIYQVNWDATGMASGVYYYRLQSAGQVDTRRMTLIK
ncbi:MAG: T9SS type A sorting domain-containing protein [Balneolaceae bacterium]|nr:T9SS type A sorting domain-containing protein [Balneolaceae bacterium]